MVWSGPVWCWSHKKLVQSETRPEFDWSVWSCVVWTLQTAKYAYFGKLARVKPASQQMQSRALQPMPGAGLIGFLESINVCWGYVQVL